MKLLIFYILLSTTISYASPGHKKCVLGKCIGDKVLVTPYWKRFIYQGKIVGLDLPDKVDVAYSTGNSKRTKIIEGVDIQDVSKEVKEYRGVGRGDKIDYIGFLGIRIPVTIYAVFENGYAHVYGSNYPGGFIVIDKIVRLNPYLN